MSSVKIIKDADSKNVMVLTTMLSQPVNFFAF